MERKAGVEAGVETALGGEGTRGEWDEWLAVWLTEAPRAVIGDSIKPISSWYLSKLISATKVEDWT